jgi:hypothetical protein
MHRKNNIVVSIALGDLKNETHVQLGDTVHTLFTATGPDVTEMVTLPAFFGEALAHEKLALDANRKSDRTNPLAEQDRVRDRVFRGFSDAVKGLTNHFREEVCADAVRVWNILSIYGNIAHKTLDDETAAINDLLNKLAAPELKEVIDRLKITDWAAALGEENRKFQALMMARYGEAAGKTPYRMKTARRETDKYFRAIAQEIEVIVMKGKAKPAFHEFLAQYNAILTRFAGIAEREKGGGKGPDAPPADPA